MSNLCSKYRKLNNTTSSDPVASIVIMCYVLLVHCHEMLPWRVHILTKQSLISKVTAQKHLYIDILPSSTFYLDEMLHLIYVKSRWWKYLPWAKPCTEKITFPEIESWSRRLYLHVRLQHMDNQIGQHKAASFFTQADDPITNGMCIHPSMFLLGGLIYQAMVWSDTPLSDPPDIYI